MLAEESESSAEEEATEHEDGIDAFIVPSLPAGLRAHHDEGFACAIETNVPGATLTSFDSAFADSASGPVIFWIILSLNLTEYGMASLFFAPP